MKQQLRKGKKWLSLFLAMVMLLACLPSGALAAGGDSPDPGIQSVTGITKMSIWGQQLAAVAIEYGSQVDPGSISEDSYDVKALVADTDGEVASAPIAAVYTNAAPETLEDRESVPGRYVIVELDVDFSDGTNLDNKIGRLVTTYYENGGKILEYWCCDDDMDYLRATAEQKSEVKTVDGTAVKASDPVRVDTWVNVGMDDFDSMTLINPDQSEEYQQLHINYYLPEGYDGESGTQYPLMIQLVGGGCSYYEKTLSDGTVINNNGTNLAFDPSALTWLDSPEPIIIAAVHTRFVMGGGYDGASDIIMAAEYLRDNFNVDPGRIYLTGNSAGTNNGGLAVQQRPDLFAACILCNGNPFQVNCGKNPFTGATSEPYGMKEEVIQTMTENRIPLFFCHGIGDSMANYYESYKPYQELYQAYTAAGEELVYELEGEADTYTSVDPKTDEEATQLLRIRLFSTDEMDAVGVTNYHGATKYAYYKHGQELMKWALAQSKSGAESGIQSVTAITDMALFGQQLAAAAIEYDSEIDPQSIDADAFDVKALVVDTDGETALAPVSRVYTNSAPEMRPDGTSVAGRYVIVELQLDTPDNTVGRKVTNYYYDAVGEDGNPTRSSKGYWYATLEALKCTVSQTREISAKNGTVYAAVKDVPATDEVNLKTQEFDSLILPSAADGTDLHIWYHLPDNYDPSKEYPMVMQMVGGGTSYWELEVDGATVSNYGTSLAMDASATAWLDAPEDTIIVSVHNRFDLFNNTPPVEIVQAVEYFEAHYSVDKDRVYMTGNSFGTIMAARALVARPDLFAGVLLCNGNLGLGQIPGPGSPNDTDPEYIADALSQVIGQKVAIWFNHGRSDGTAKVEESIVPYETIRSIYQEEGLSDEEIDAILRLSVFEDAEMEAIGIYNYHQATRYAYYTQADEMMAWMLSQSKENYWTKPATGGTSSSTYAVSIADSGNGTVKTSLKRAAKGATVVLTVKPDEGYELDELVVTDSKGNELKLTDRGDGKYAFTMPAAKVTVEAFFTKTAAEPEQPTAPAMSFVDVSEKDWFYNAVAYAYENGLMSGTSATTFAPNDKLTRAMVAQVIYNLEGTPAVSGTQFTDVAAGMWYTNAITWAAQNGLVSGYGDGKFGPNDLVTREQLAVILNHYAQFKKMTAAATGSLAAFTDGSEASGWAVNALIWAVDNGVMAGKGNSTLDPKGTATRAEVAQMFMNFLEA